LRIGPHRLENGRGRAVVDDRLAAFADALRRFPPGHSEGLYDGRRYGVTLTASPDGRRIWLFGEELGGTRRVSFNLYRLDGLRLELRPCEMPRDWVIDFILRFHPDNAG
jgi:hypothetical protein